jgi:uncharacterized protein (TIGR02217 family)
MSELNIYENRTYATEPLLSVSVEWSTQITENRGGKENRIPKITEPRFTIEGSDFVLRDDDYDLFKQFFIDSEGKAGTFPFKCPLDYYCSHEPESLDADSYCQGIVVGIEGGNSRIVKKYTVGSVSSYKTIIKPVEGTVLIYDGETLIEPTPTIDYETGIITGDYDGMTVSCQFRLPMRFDVDDLQLTQIKRAIDDARVANDTSIYIPVNFRLVEDMNYDRSSPLLAEDWKTTNDYVFDGSPLADVTYADRKLTRISLADNKREVKDGLNVNRRKYLIADNAMPYLSAVRYYNLFMASKGRLVPFEFEDTLVRLDSDTFNAQMESNPVWTVTGLDMIQVLNNGENEIKTWAHYIDIGTFVNNTLACMIGGTYTADLRLLASTSDEPRETITATFDLSMFQGDVLPVSAFALDDFSFIVQSDFDINSAYSLDGSTRIINLPSHALVVVDGNNPNLADGSIDDPLTTNYVFGGQTYSIPGGETMPLSEAIQGVIDMGVLSQPHNAISLSQMAARGFISDNIISFKIMHVNHGSGLVRLTIDVPQCT